VDENKPDKFVVVNIPSATLWAVEGGKVAFEMPVIVGRTKRPTNMFITEIQGVRFNPNWTVPPTIKRDDILPKLQADPEYLTHKGMELIGLTDQGRVSLDPASIDWSTITAEDLQSLRFVQDAGNNNPLGRVRVLMPNAYNIYLHDTNEKYYFDRSQRAVSSGCVRMKDPELMAEFIMKNRSSWEDGDMEAMFAHGKTRDVSIDTPIPVYLLYYTVWVNQKGDLVYGNDLYNHDESLIKMLSELDGIFIPVNNNEMSMANSAR
jgi:murein L,D-transpeptidase YcbB/YkuD